MTVEGRCTVALQSQRADERRGARDGKQRGIAVWRWENAPEVRKPGLEHHTHLVVRFLENDYLVKSRKLCDIFQKLEGLIDAKNKSLGNIAERSFVHS